MRHDTDKVEGGLMVLFFGLVFSIATIPPEIFSVYALAYLCSAELNTVQDKACFIFECQFIWFISAFPAGPQLGGQKPPEVF